MEVIQLGPVNLLRTIFIILLVYYGFKLLWPIVRKMFFTPPETSSHQKNARRGRRGMTVEAPNRDKKNPSSDDLGDFVDYEEIK